MEFSEPTSSWLKIGGYGNSACGLPSQLNTVSFQNDLQFDGYYRLVIGSGIFGFGLWALSKSTTLLVCGVLQVASLCKEQLHRGNGERRKVYFHPVIEFEPTEGNLFQFTFGSGSTRRRPVTSDKVKGVYEIDEPDKATLNSFTGLWAGPLAALVLGGGCRYGAVQLVFYAVR